MAEILLYDYTELVEDGWFGSYEQSFVIGQGKLSGNNVVAQIQAVPENEEITVRINSVGGFVFDGWAIYNALKSHKANVTVRIEGIAASIASIIAMAGDNVIICQAAILMIHKPTIDPYWCGCMDAEDLKREAAALDQIQSVLNSIYVAKTGLDSASIDSLINAETYITPAEAVTMGFADSIDNTITESSLAENSFRHIFKNADAKTKAYANKFFNKIAPKNMESPTLKAVNESLEKNTSLLTQVSNFLKDFLPKNQKEEETEEEKAERERLEAEQAEQVEKERLEKEEADRIAAEQEDLAAKDARIAELEASVAERETALNTANAALEASNSALEKIAKVQSKFTPPTRNQTFEKPSNEAPKENSKFVKPIKNKK